MASLVEKIKVCEYLYDLFAKNGTRRRMFYSFHKNLKAKSKTH